MFKQSHAGTDKAGILNINYRVFNCHVPDSLREGAASAKKSLLKDLQKSIHAHAHALTLKKKKRPFKCAQNAKGGKGGLNVERVCADIKRSPAIGFAGEDSNLRCSNICCGSRRILMVIKQKAAVFPLSPAGDPHNTLVNVTHVGT